MLIISKTLYYKTMNDYKFVEPKTQASNRTIYIDADTIKELQEWKAVQAKVLPNCGFVLSYNSTPTSKTTLPRALEKLANLAGVHRIKIHALRHSHASLLISMGENPLLIKERLGHEKIQTTLGTYGHLYPNTNIEIAKKLTGFSATSQLLKVLLIIPVISILQCITKKYKNAMIMQFQTPKAAKPRGYGLCSPASTIQTRKVLFALWCSPVISVLEQFVFELLCMNLLCFHLIVLSFYCQ